MLWKIGLAFVALATFLYTFWAVLAVSRWNDPSVSSFGEVRTPPLNDSLIGALGILAPVFAGPTIVMALLGFGLVAAGIRAESRK